MHSQYLSGFRSHPVVLFAVCSTPLFVFSGLYSQSFSTRPGFSFHGCFSPTPQTDLGVLFALSLLSPSSSFFPKPYRCSFRTSPRSGASCSSLCGPGFFRFGVLFSLASDSQWVVLFAVLPYSFTAGHTRIPVWACSGAPRPFSSVRVYPFGFIT